MTLLLAADLATNPELMALPEILAPPCGVAGRVALVTLGPKGGKSSTGGASVAEATRRGIRCAVLTLDEAMADTLQRLVRFGAALDRVWLSDRFDPATLEAELVERSIELLIVDHLGKIAEGHPDFGPGSQGDPLLWGRLVAPFTTLARSINLAVILLDQARKSDGKYAGSTAKAGSVDLLVEMELRDGGLEATPRGRIPLPPFRVELDAEGIPRFSGGGLDFRGATGPTDAAAARALLQLLAESEPEGLTSSAWEKMSGQAKTSFNRHRRALLRGGLALSPAETRRGARYRITDEGERSLSVPLVPLGAIGTTALIGRNGAIGAKPLIEGLARVAPTNPTDSYEGAEREAVKQEAVA